MGRMATAGSLGLVLVSAAMARAQEGAPPLRAPASTSSAGNLDAPAELPPVFEARPLRSQGPVLAVPGLAVPGGPPRAPRTSVSTTTDLPPLVGPAEAFGSNPGLPSWSGAPGSLPGSSVSGRAMSPGMTPNAAATLNSLPESAIGLDPNPNPRDDRTRSSNPLPSRARAPSRPRLFGRLQGPNSLRSRESSKPDDAIAVEPRSDPAANAALKRRLELQIQNAVGNRVRSVDVKVIDREISIHARVTRFWNRRNVKHTLETLPGLTGYHTTVDVVD
jgi:hypothetical protein